MIGENGGSYGTVLVKDVAITSTPTPYTYAFTAAASYPAATTAGGPYEGQLAFQVGGRGADWTFTIDSVSLVESATPPPVYQPNTGPRVRVNQVGYLPNGPKMATLVTVATDAVPWELRNSSNVKVANGTSTPKGVDASSALNVQVIDFSRYTAAGTDFTLVGDGETSRPFDINASVYQQLRYDALNYFYLVRSGIAVDPAINTAYARPAGHIDVAPNKGDGAVPCLTKVEEGASWSYGDWTCPAGYTLDVEGGWYDAGDHGKYVVNGGIATAQLLSTYERTLHAPTVNAGALADGTLSVPESTNGVPDVLDEARWELEFMLSMQVPADGGMYAGMVHHKIHDLGWTGLPLLPSNDPKERRLAMPSTAATLNMAAAAAQGARLFADFDPAFAAKLLNAAQTAWDAAQAHPAVYAPAGAGNNGGGAYDDANVTDEFYWAAAELYLTTGEQKFEQAVLTNKDNGVADDATSTFGAGGFSWGGTAALGRLDLATVPNALPTRPVIRQSVIDAADRYVAAQAGQSFGSTYVPTDGVYAWGSNSTVLNNSVVIATAFDLTGTARYRTSVLESMDYLLGRNALNQSYVTGWGEVSTQHQHNRWFSESTAKASPVGSLAGGPNSGVGTWDPTMQATFTKGCAPSMCYLDEVQSWASNEVAINWNSALSWVASFVADQAAGNVVPAGSAPTIGMQPADTAAAPEATVTFTASATGSPTPTVRWQSRTGSGAWMDLTGATTASLSFAAQAGDDGRQYRAVFTNTLGWSVTDGAKLSVSAPAADPARATLSSDSVRAGGDVTMSITGMAPGEPVEVTLHSAPVLLGSQMADGSGAVRMTVRIPATTEVGAHTLTAVGMQSGRQASVSITVLAAAPVAAIAGAARLASSGSEGTGWLVGLALLALLAGSGVFTAARRTREG